MRMIAHGTRARKGKKGDPTKKIKGPQCIIGGVTLSTRWPEAHARPQVIEIGDSELRGGSDPRADGAALGW